MDSHCQTSGVFLRCGGRGRIRTTEGVCQLIYSQPPLAAWVPVREGGGRRIRTTEGVCQLIYSQSPLAAWVSLQDRVIQLDKVHPKPPIGLEPITYALQVRCSTD